MTKYQTDPPVTVRPTNARPTFGRPTEWYRVTDAWTVWRGGYRTPFVIVDTKTGLTMIAPDADGRYTMRTCWHLGISPGDLARLHADELAEA